MVIFIYCQKNEQHKEFYDRVLISESIYDINSVEVKLE